MDYGTVECPRCGKVVKLKPARRAGRVEARCSCFKGNSFLEKDAPQQEVDEIVNYEEEEEDA